MNIDSIRKEREKWLEWKDIKPIQDKLNSLKEFDCKYELDDIIKIDGAIDKIAKQELVDLAKMLKPWRKGPFEIFGTKIDSEWQSNIKYNLLSKYFDLEGKSVADIGCNNGYYMFRFLKNSPKKIVGFDPSPLYKSQFDFINHFIKSDITYEMLGIEHLEFYEEKFDTIFCLGVLYHRSDPISSLKSLKKSLSCGGELFLDTFIIDGNEDIALTPKNRYSKIPNIYFIPTVNALKNWCLRAGFKEFTLLEIKKTTNNEQRKTDWIKGESLENFLNPSDPNYTVEGYPAPKRAYIRVNI
ncbi:MAG: tRNA 5-methoxyuridine(34)/uridine 5-oxyacetic acid(34) synthase CmoB [Sulfurospirillum sp.]|nr:MAG: tRNA 5-methoxyuridine(34)/uridine 5-oxyacetic acid(34) synthase CmoB [Sulfurospirillum sp.]